MSAPEQAHGRWTAPVLAAVLLGVEAVIVAESWRGLVGFAGLIGITGVAAWGVPITLDGVSLVAALVALRAELAGEASGLYRMTLFTFTAASCAANYWHARHVGGEAAALYLGGMSIAVAVVFALALRQIRHEDRRRAGTVTGRLPRFSVAHWGRYPRLTWRAWSLSVRDGHTSPRSALDAALGRRSQESPGSAPPASPGAPPVALPGSTRKALPGASSKGASGPKRKRAIGRTAKRARQRVTDTDAEMYFRSEVLSGSPVSARRIQGEMHVGWPRAQELRDHLESVIARSTSTAGGR